MLQKERPYKASLINLKFNVVTEILLCILRWDMGMRGQHGCIEVTELRIKAKLESAFAEACVQGCLPVKNSVSSVNC